MQPEKREEIVQTIKYWHRQRIFGMDQRKRSDLALGAFLRTQLGWRRDLPPKEAKEIASKAANLVEIQEKIFAEEAKLVKKRAKAEKLGANSAILKEMTRSAVDGEDDPAFLEWQRLIFSAMTSSRPFLELEDTAKSNMEKLAKSLPVWDDFGAGVDGFGASSLAVLIGEAGDLSKYSTVSKLWKRMGLAVIGDVRQGGLKRTATAEEWIAHGYSKPRRSRMFLIGGTLIGGMGNGPRPLVGQDVTNSNELSPYQKLFVHRIRYEAERDPEAHAKEPVLHKETGELKESFSAHAAKRARRYVEKRFLRDIWRAWRRGEAGFVDQPFEFRHAAE